jgi:hypothetical protein
MRDSTPRLRSGRCRISTPPATAKIYRGPLLALVAEVHRLRQAGGGAERRLTLRRQQLQPLANAVLGLAEALEAGRG